MKAKVFLSVSLFIGLMSAVSLSAAVLDYGVGADWSDTVNPNGQWAYGILSTGGIFTPFATHNDHYINVGPAAFSGNQPAWTNTVDTGDNGTPEGLAKSIGVALIDFPAGSVGGFTPVDGYLAIRWTAPRAGLMNICCSVWTDSHAALSFFVNGVARLKDLTIPVPVGNGFDGDRSSNPMPLSTALGSSIPRFFVNTGDTLTLGARSIDAPAFVGFDYRVSTYVPEPMTSQMMLAGLLGFAGVGAFRILGRYWRALRVLA